MDKKTLVIALGGNALGNNPKEQLELVKQSAKAIVELVKNDIQVVIAHGNGPQVGMINLAFESSQTPSMPFAECGAMSQGYIGYHLQQALYNELQNQNIQKSVTSIVTQVEVDENDVAFKDPTKPIGSFYAKDEMEKIMAENKDYVFVEDAGRGYRRVVASPKPLRIIEKETIKQLINADHIVIAIGGGGIPVVRKDGLLKGIDAVIDKDHSASVLASEIKADKLIILTAVDQVCINFNKPDQKTLSHISLNESIDYIKQGHFAKGSMLPKVEACINFVEKNSNASAIITSLQNAANAIHGKNCTTITKD